MNWSLRIQPGDTEIGDNTLVSVTAKLGMDIGRTGRVPRTNTLGFTTDVRRVAVGDEVALYRLQPAAQAVWTGEAHNIRNLVDRPLNVQRYRVEAQGVIAKLVSFGSGLAIAPILNVTVSDAISRLLDEAGVSTAQRNITHTTRQLSIWWLDQTTSVWNALLTLARTAGPHWRIYEDEQGRINFDAREPSAVATHTMFGRNVASAGGAIISRFENYNAGIDRIVNRVDIERRVLLGLDPPRIAAVASHSEYHPTGNAFVTFSESGMRAAGVTDDDVVVFFYSMASVDLSGFALPSADWTEIAQTTNAAIAPQPGARAATQQSGVVWRRGPKNFGVETLGAYSLANVVNIVYRNAADPLRGNAVGDNPPDGGEQYPIAPLADVDDASVLLIGSMGVQVITTPGNPPSTTLVAASPTVTAGGLATTESALSTSQQLKARYAQQSDFGPSPATDVWSYAGGGSFTGTAMANMSIEVPLVREVVWEHDGDVVVQANATISIEAVIDGAFASPALPNIAAGDYTLSSGSASITFGVESRRGYPTIEITAGANGATLVGLRLRAVDIGNAEIDVVSRSSTASRLEYGVRPYNERVWEFLSNAEAFDLAVSIITASAFPRPSWDLVLDADRDTPTQAAAFARIGETARVHVDNNFDELGEIVGAQRQISGQAGLLLTRYKMLATEALPPDPNLLYLDSIDNPLMFLGEQLALR